MSETDRPIDDRHMVACGSYDALILLTASVVGSSGTDAADNGMANAIQAAFVEAGAFLIGILGLLFLTLWNQRIRIALIVLLVMVSLMLPMLLS